MVVGVARPSIFPVDFGPQSRLPILAADRAAEAICAVISRGFDRVLDQYFGDYVTVFVFMAVGALLVGGGLFASSLLRPDKPSKVKSEIYECGINPVGGGWSQTHIRYYIFALLFLIFDVEAIFIFPWALRIESFAADGQGIYVLVVMVLFIGTLLEGLLYAIRKGVLKWE
jgi:NADH-quinone oxidoreductase subunit A